VRMMVYWQRNINRTVRSKVRSNNEANLSLKLQVSDQSAANTAEFEVRTSFQDPKSRFLQI
jgi:hypothetical protein